MGSRTDAALEAVVAARADFGDEVDRLEAAGRTAVDIPAKVRANPAKAAGVAAGGAFLALGGPKRVFRRAKRTFKGKEEELPSELLPKEIDEALRKIGTDGKAVRGTLERDFARYLDVRRNERRQEGLIAAISGLAVTTLRPLALRGGIRLAQRAFDPNRPVFNDQLARIRERARDASGSKGTAEKGAPKDAGL